MAFCALEFVQCNNGACHNGAQHTFCTLEFIQFDSLRGLVDNCPSKSTTDCSDPSDPSKTMPQTITIHVKTQLMSRHSSSVYNLS
eukprot:3492130-Rhodomonas_salina.2